MFFHVRYGALQVLDSQRLAGNHRMQRNAHDPRLLAAVGVECIELVDNRPQILFAGVAFADIKRDIVDLIAVGDRKHLSRFHFHRIRLIVIVPVPAIVHAFFGKKVEGVVGFDQSGAEPAAGRFPGRLLDCSQDAADRVALLL